MLGGINCTWTRLSFFLPRRLIDFEYFKSDGNTDSDYIREAEQFQSEIDFAFFAVNFGYSKADYESLTPKEQAFIYKAWENKTITDSYNIYNAVFKAVYNANRSKKQRALSLFRKVNQPLDKEKLRNDKEIIAQANKNDGNWIEKIYKANHIPYKKKEVT